MNPHPGHRYALGLQPLQHPAGMAPVSQGGVQASLARLYLKELQYLIYHDRDMHTHRGTSLLDIWRSPPQAPHPVEYKAFLTTSVLSQS